MTSPRSPEPGDPPAVVLRRHPRARRYTLRLGRDGVPVVTVPRGGSRREALAFVARHLAWLETRQRERSGAAGHSTEWRPGLAILLRGEPVVLALGRLHGRPFVEFGNERVFLASDSVNLRRPVEARLLALARRELPARVRELAAAHGISIRAVSVRNQGSRWGSCSARGVISLNWRLVQAPPGVRDYLIVHELMHRLEMNHSRRFWRLVEAACPGWRQAEAWLGAHAVQLGF